MNGTRWLRRLVLAHALLLCCCMARAQLKLGSNPATINKSSILELESVRQGLLLPRIPDTTVTTLNTAPNGTLIFFTGDNSLRIRKNGFWRRVADSANFWQNAGAAGGDLTGTFPGPLIAPNAVTYAKMQQLSATNTLLGRYAAGAGNVQEITLGAGLSFTGNVLNASITGTTAGGDLTGSYPNPSIAAGVVTYAKMQNVSASSILGRYAGTAGTAQEITLGTGLSFTGSVLNSSATGAASGDLTGTYPAPTIAANAVTYGKIQAVSSGALLGRFTAGSGTVQEITLGTGLSLNTSTGVLTAATNWLLGGNPVASEQNLGTTSAFALPFITGGFERMRIASGGFVGINTTNPTSTLHVRSGTTDASGLRLENLVYTSPVTTDARAIGVDASGNVVRVSVPVYYSGGIGGTASVGTVTKVWIADVVNGADANGAQTITIPTNVGFANILNVQVTARGGTGVTNAPIATVTSATTTQIVIRLMDSKATGLLGGVLSIEGLEPHTAALNSSTHIYIRIEGN